ncbi:MAG: DNA-directed RNA polymerase subunit alpha C-terminal domain-containing protein [Pirellulaceae bacterium]|nr:DNA-directed RNA polymerase subunit alpha C-terminal domain-containing protein [Pirellulaceae bacterium]
MSQVMDFDVRDVVLSDGSFGPQEIKQIIDSVSQDATRLTVLRDAVAELETRESHTPASTVRLGVCQYLLGQYELSYKTLSNADGGALAHFYQGKAKLYLCNYDAATTSFESAKRAGYDPGICELGVTESLRGSRKSEEALQRLDNLSGAVEQTAGYLYQRGATIAALGGNPEEVCALYERAVESDGGHAGALFGLALENDRRGNDDVAVGLYQRATARFPSHVGALLNLGILYEDREQYDRAQKCYQRILDSFPAHDRANLFLQDAQASGDMYYDEEAQKKRDRMSQVLGVPVTDFELSVRSRNCLQKMGIGTLGDLTRCTEQELLASKNFGETSLIEIREMLRSKGLDLGQFAHEKAEPEPTIDYQNMSPDEQALLERPISELNLSVRARKCMVRLGISTVGELLRRTGDDLLECKNFGVTSLTEVREKLTQHALKLRGD